MRTVRERLTQWQAVHSIGRRPGTQRFSDDVVKRILRDWVNPDEPAADVPAEKLTEVARLLADLCPSRWNASISALRFVSEHANQLKKKRLRFKDFSPPTHEQFQQLLAELDKVTRTNAALAVRLLAMTGLRISEARALKWEQIFPDRVQVASLTSKSGRVRSIPLLPGVKEILDKLRESKPNADYFEHNVRRDYVLRDANFRCTVARACRRIGIKPIGYHGFRHLFATRCIEAGVDMPTVARWMGHQDGGSLLSRMYFHLLDSHSREMASKVRI